jgi:hypothetical protein
MSDAVSSVRGSDNDKIPAKASIPKFCFRMRPNFCTNRAPAKMLKPRQPGCFQHLVS